MQARGWIIAIVGAAVAAISLLGARLVSDPLHATTPSRTDGIGPAAGAGGTAPMPADGFRFDRSHDRHAVVPGLLPAPGESRVQPSTGARIQRVAHPGLVVYSRYTPTSIDNALLLVHGEDSTSARIVERASGRLVRELPGLGEVNEIRWHYGADAPSRVYYVTGMQFRRMDARTGDDVLVRDFTREWPAGTQLFTDVEGDSSNDSRHWCWMVRREVPEGSYPVELLVSYDRVADTVATADARALGRASMGRPNTIEASPGGGACVVHWGADEGRPQAWTRDWRTKIRDLAVDATHSGWILDAAGGDWFVSQNNRNDQVEAVSLQSGEVRRLIGHGDLGWDNGMHFSKDYAGTGHVLLSTYAPTTVDDARADWGDNQLILLDLHGRVLRVASTHNAWPGDDGYRNEAAAALSYDGRHVYWTGNWGQGGRVRDVYGIELPAAWWAR